MSDETYNGWKNYPTWAVNLWLSGDESLYNETLGRVSEITSETESKSDYWTLEESHLHTTTSMLRDFAEELAGEAYNEASFVADLLGYAFDCVDWQEIADAWIESVKEQVSA